jgi:hypothetical protein
MGIFNSELLVITRGYLVKDAEIPVLVKLLAALHLFLHLAKKRWRSERDSHGPWGYGNLWFTMVNDEPNV